MLIHGSLGKGMRCKACGTENARDRQFLRRLRRAAAHTLPSLLVRQ